MFATAARWAAKNGKPKMAPIELTTPPEQTQSITRAIFDVVSEHGRLTIWEHVKARTLFGGTCLWEQATPASVDRQRHLVSDDLRIFSRSSEKSCVNSPQEVELRGLTSKRQMKTSQAIPRLIKCSLPGENQ